MKVILGTPGLILRKVEESDLEGDTMVWFEKDGRVVDEVIKG